MPDYGYYRRPNRKLYLIDVLEMIHDDRWFSARQIANLVYLGRGKPHSQQVSRIRDELDKMAHLGCLLRDDTQALCPLYRFDTVVNQDKRRPVAMATDYERNPKYPDNSQIEWHIRIALDRLIPADFNPRAYTPGGERLITFDDK